MPHTFTIKVINEEKGLYTVLCSCGVGIANATWPEAENWQKAHELAYKYARLMFNIETAVKRSDKTEYQICVAVATMINTINPTGLTITDLARELAAQNEWDVTYV